MTYSKRKWLLVLAGLVCLAALLLGGVYFLGGRENPISEIDTVRIQSDYATAASLESMVQQSEYIVVGRYTAYDSSYNMARSTENADEEDPERYVEGRLYHFQVEEVLKGELEPGDILVNLRYSETMTVTESNAVKDETGLIIQPATQERTISFVVYDPLYLEPELEQTCILFLDRIDRTGNFSRAMEPFWIVEEDGAAELRSNLIGSSELTQTATLEDGRTITVDYACASLDDFISGSFEDVVQAAAAFADAE